MLPWWLSTQLSPLLSLLTKPCHSNHGHSMVRQGFLLHQFQLEWRSACMIDPGIFGQYCFKAAHDLVLCSGSGAEMGF
jgi:hypothetical protein